MADANVLELSNKVVDACIEIRKNHKTKLPDAIIAATAVVFELVLISRNVSDFKNIKGGQVIDPHNLYLSITQAIAISKNMESNTQQYRKALSDKKDWQNTIFKHKELLKSNNNKI